MRLKEARGWSVVQEYIEEPGYEDNVESVALRPLSH